MSGDLPVGKLRNLLGYAGLVRDELRMQNWDIVLLRTAHDEGEDVWAHTWQNDNHCLLNIQISEDLLKARPDTVRNTIVHELTHAQHRDLSRLWDSRVLDNASVSAASSRTWDEDFRVYVERFVSWATARIQETVTPYDPGRRYPIRTGCYLDGDQPS